MRRGRLLERAGLEPQELEFCIRKDLRFSKVNLPHLIITVITIQQDVLAATEFELMNTLDQPLESIRKIVEQVAKKEAPACCTVLVKYIRVNQSVQGSTAGSFAWAETHTHWRCTT